MPVGYATGTSFDPRRTNWDGDGPRPLKWTVWYPAGDDAIEAPLTGRSWFKAGPVARDATIRDGTHTVILLSHGTGGVAASLEWLAHRLAREGFIALAVDHHGNTGSERRRAEGFLCLWERAADLTALLDGDDWRQKLNGMIGPEAFVAGFSAGALAAMLLMGARLTHSQYEEDAPHKSTSRGPREFPDLVDHLPRLLENNQVFRNSWKRRRADYADARFAAALVLAPGRSVLGFDPSTLAAIKKPVRIMVGDADIAAPPEQCSGWLHRNVPGSELEIIGGGVGHYTFLPEPTPMGLKLEPAVFTDAPGVDRRTIHDHVATAAARLFAS